MVKNNYRYEKRKKELAKKKKKKEKLQRKLDKDDGPAVVNPGGIPDEDSGERAS